MMDAGILLCLNLLTIPFVSEAEILGGGLKKWPRISDILKLKNTRRERWFKWFLFLFLLISLIYVVPVLRGQWHDVSLKQVLILLGVQVATWGYAAFRIRH